MLAARPRGQPLSVGNRASERRLLPEDLAAELRRAREARGLSLRHAARLAGISAGYLSRLERGHRAPRLPVALMLIDVLDLDEDLAGELLDEAVPS